MLYYRVSHGFRLTKQDDYFWVDFDHFWSEHHFWGSWGSSENLLEPRIRPPLANLACPNMWNALYDLRVNKKENIFENFERTLSRSAFLRAQSKARFFTTTCNFWIEAEINPFIPGVKKYAAHRPHAACIRVQWGPWRSGNIVIFSISRHFAFLQHVDF